MPLLNGYKEEFVLKRLPQSLLGGLKVHLGYTAPFYVYVNQLVLFLFPFLLGGILTIITELAGVRFDIVCYVYGVLMVIYVLLVQIISLARTRRASVSPDFEAKHNILSEDDEIDFESCCGRATVQFVSTVKPFWILIPLHAMMSGVVSALGLWFLLPSVLNSLYGSTAGTVCITILGWLALCIGLYSLTVEGPPELSQYRALVTYDYVPARPVHMLLFFIVNAVALSVTDPSGTLTLVNQVLHGVFCALPVLWLSGMLPAAEPLLLWALEQYHVHVLGGSYMADPIRTLVITSLSSLTLLVYLARQTPSTALLLFTALGYTLSLDLCGAFSALLTQRTRLIRGKTHGQICCAITRIAWYCAMLGLACAATALTTLYNSTVHSGVLYMGYCAAGMLCLDYALKSLQKVYWFGLLRNPLFPPDVNKSKAFRRRRKILYVIGLLRRFFRVVVYPLLMLVYLVSSLTTESPSITSFWSWMMVARALRWVFQSTESSLLDISVHVIVTVSLPISHWWTSIPTANRLFLISLLRSRLREFGGKLYTFLVIILETVRDWKSYDNFRCEKFVKAVLPLLLVPLYLCFVLVPASVLSAPVLPLFTLPWFWIGAPRPRRFWAPQYSWRGRREEEASGDAVFYQQAVPELTDMVNRAISVGSLDAHPGSQYLLRYQDRLVWISVLELGYAYTTLQLKGLELQETSCHTVEAARIDQLFEDAFERESCFGFNRHAFNTLTAKDCAFVGTYSDAKNVLTGVIDSPENLRMVFDDLSKTLTWVFLNHLLNPKRLPVFEPAQESIDLNTLPTVNVSQKKLPPMNHSKTPDSGKRNGLELKAPVPLPPLSTSTNHQVARPSTPENVKNSNLKSRDMNDLDLEELLDDWDSPRNSPAPLVAKNERTKVSLLTGRAISPALSETESIWSTDSTDQVPLKPVRSKKSNLLPAFSNRIDDFNYEDEDRFSPPYFNDDRFGAKASTNLMAEFKFKTSLARQFEPPAQWLNVPMEREKLDSIMRALSLNSWIRTVIGRVSLSRDMDQNVQNLSEDDGFCKMIQYFVAIGRFIFYEQLTSDRASSLGTSHLYKSFCGQIYNTSSEDWLNRNPDLRYLFLKAYRYSVKLMIDQAVLGPMDDSEEFADSLSEYDLSWYIGQQSDKEWNENINNSTLNLFSITHSAYNNLYSSRTLSRIELPVYAGSLNDELVRAQWANLSLELLYMTNDDEERDSIQAQETILRNLTVQAADPPLGYPLYTSKTISIQNL